VLLLRVDTLGGALMRIDPVFTVVFAIALVALAGNHSDGSGLTDRATRSAQLSRLTQTPNSQPAGQSGPESSTSAVPALLPAAPPPDPSSGMPAVVLDDQEVFTILGKSVRSSAYEDMGHIVDIIVSRDGQIHAVIIDFGGLLGIGTRRIAVDWRVLNFAPAGKPGAISHFVPGQRLPRRIDPR
jgi:hypothetical protein